MGRSVLISAALHAAIILWIVVVLPGARPLNEPPVREIPVDLVKPSEVTNIKAGTKDAKSMKALASKPKPKPSDKAKKPKLHTKQAVLPPPPAPKPKPPEPEKAEKKPLKAMPKPVANVPAPKAPEKTAEKEPPPGLPLTPPRPPKAKPKPKKRIVRRREQPKRTHRLPSHSKESFDTDRIAALLNKVPDTGSGPSADKPSPDSQRHAHGQTNGVKLTLSVDEIDALRARIAQCWNPPPGGLGAGHIVIQLHMRLNRDGTLVGYPTVQNSGSSSFFRAAADAAVRAVYKCQPYELPAAKYSLWRDMILNFDPSEMYRAGQTGQMP